MVWTSIWILYGFAWANFILEYSFVLNMMGVLWFDLTQRTLRMGWFPSFHYIWNLNPLSFCMWITLELKKSNNSSVIEEIESNMRKRYHIDDSRHPKHCIRWAKMGYEKALILELTVIHVAWGSLDTKWGHILRCQGRPRKWWVQS